MTKEELEKKCDTKFKDYDEIVQFLKDEIEKLKNALKDLTDQHSDTLKLVLNNILKLKEKGTEL